MAAGRKRNELWSYSQKPLYRVLEETIILSALLSPSLVTDSLQNLIPLIFCFTDLD